MKIDEKKVETKVETTTPSPASGEEKKPSNEVEVDYKKELEIVKAEKEAKEKELSQAQFKIQELKKEKKNAPTEDDEDEKIDVEAIRAKISEDLRQELSKTQQALIGDTVEDMVADITDNPDEQALILHHYENSIQKTGFNKKSILNDLTNAYVIANKPRIEAEQRELKKAIVSKQTKSTAPAVAGDGSTGSDTAKLSPSEEAWIQSASARTGLKPDEIRKKLLLNKK